MRQPVYSKEKMLTEGHWKSEAYVQRMTTRCWKLILLNNDDQITFEGRVRRLIGKNIGFGVVEVSKVK
jgi:hypothetical protein